MHLATGPSSDGECAVGPAGPAGSGRSRQRAARRTAPRPLCGAARQRFAPRSSGPKPATRGIFGCRWEKVSTRRRPEGRSPVGRWVMPLRLEPLDVSAELENISSILIVSCPVCPPVSLAIERRSPFLEVFKRGLRTGAFEDHIQGIREPLEQRGIRTDVFSLYGPVPMMCLWTKGQRRRLSKRARAFDAVLVLGCDSATHSARRALEDSGCRTIQAMKVTGITNAAVKFQFPGTVTLEEATRVDRGEETGKGAS